MPYLELTNATRTGPVSKELTFDAHAGLQYRHYGNSEVSSQYSDAWNPNAGLSLSLGGAQFGFGVADVFARIEDPPYANPGNLNANGDSQRGACHRAHQQSGVDRRPLVPRGWAPHHDAALHQHGEHL